MSTPNRTDLQGEHDALLYSVDFTMPMQKPWPISARGQFPSLSIPPCGFGDFERSALLSPGGRQGYTRIYYKLTTLQCKKHATPSVVLECAASTRPARPSLHRGAPPRPGASHTTPYIKNWSAGPTSLVGQQVCLGRGSKRWLLDPIYVDM